MPNEWKKLYSAPLRPSGFQDAIGNAEPTWKLSSKPLPSPAEKAAADLAIRQAEADAKLKAHKEMLDAQRKAQKQADDKAHEREWMLTNLPFKLQELDRTKKQLKDVQDEVARMIVENASLKLSIEQAKYTAMISSSGGGMIGKSPINVAGNTISWDWTRESFGVHKRDADKVWVHNGYIRGADTYYFVDSAALTVSDTQVYVYVSQAKAALTTTIAQSTTMPDDTTTHYRWPLVRLARTDPAEDGSYTWAIRKIYNVGDVPVKPMIHDANSPYGDSYKSLEKVTSNDSHYAEDQLFQFRSHTPYTVSSYEKLGSDVDEYEIVGRYASATGRAEVRYLDLSEFRAKYADSATHSDSAKYADRSGSIDSGFYHVLDTYFYSRYWRTGGTRATCYGEDIGDGNGDQVINLNDKYLVAGTDPTVDWGITVLRDMSAGHRISMNWDQRELYNDTEVAAINYNKVGWKAFFGSNDCWSASGLKVGSGAYVLKGTSAQAGYFHNPGVNTVILCDSTNAGYFDGGAGGQQVYLGGYSVASGYFAIESSGNILISDADYAYYHGGNEGQTIANWFGGGILTGTSVQEIDADDIQPTDKILVRR